MHRWQRALRSYRQSRDGLLLTNTWGDRSQDARINERFMSGEIEAGARLGADVVQIDDGWQRGRSANSVKPGGVWEGFRASDPRFWEAHPGRFPNGLKPLMERARILGMEFGLWFAPDSANDFENWLKDADCILGYFHSLGVRYFKIDGVIAVTRKGERNLRRFFDRVLDESDGKVVFDLDVTANIRPGYFGMINVGPIFVENRYTDWFNYWPHRTLRNFWQLARWIDPVRLRMEFLNNARNAALYGEDPLAPSAYSPACLFATVLFSSPLGWFETTGLDERFVSEVAELIDIRRAHRDALFSGSILPVGSVPDGVAWTGFLSLGIDDASVYALVFRELASDAEWIFSLDGISDRKVESVEVLAGKGTAASVLGGVEFCIPDHLGYLLVRVTMAP
jgi:alpha-galactosidase